MNAFPAFIPLYGARIVVVGDGEAAEAKARLVENSVAEVVRLPADLALEPATYAGARLAFIAVEDERVQREAVELAHRAGALVNVVDRQDLGDFHTPAIVDRSPVIAAIGTGGAAPVLATILRNHIESRWPEGLGLLARLSAELQPVVRRRLPDLPARRAYWRRVLTGPAAEAACAGETETARALALAALDAPTAEGKVWLLAAPERAELLSLAAVRAFAAADRIVADASVPAEVMAFARRDAKRADAAEAETLAAWAQGGELVLVASTGEVAPLREALESLGVRTERLPTAA